MVIGDIAQFSGEFFLCLFPLVGGLLFSEGVFGRGYRMLMIAATINRSVWV